MEKRKIFICILIILLSVHLTLALDTRLNFKTSPNYEIVLRIMDSIGKTVPNGVYNLKTDSSGKASLNFSSDILSAIKLSIIVRDSIGKNINYAEGDPVRIIRDVKTGWIYDIDLIPIVPVIVKGITVEEEKKQQAEALSNATVNETISAPVENNTSPNSTETSNNSSKSFISGMSITNFTSGITSKIKWKIVLYVIISIFVIAFVVFLIVAFARRSSKDSSGLGIHIGPRTNDNFKVIRQEPKMSYSEERTLREAEHKIRQAQAEIDRIKNRDKLIQEAEKRLEQDRYELERLKRRY